MVEPLMRWRIQDYVQLYKATNIIDKLKSRGDCKQHLLNTDERQSPRDCNMWMMLSALERDILKQGI